MASDTSSSDDVISLEDLVRDSGAGTPVSSPDATSSTTSAVEANSAPPELAPVTPEVAQIDSLLAAEDPQFIHAMGDLQKLGAHSTSALVDIDPLDLDKLSREKPSKLRNLLRVLAWPFTRAIESPKSFISRWSSASKGLLPASRAGLKLAISKTKVVIKAAWKKLAAEIETFSELSWKGKLTAFIALTLGALAVTTLNMTMKHKIELSFRTNFLRSFGDLADAKFVYGPSEPMEDFTDPLFHPEHVVLVDKLVVNLKQPRDGSNPMGLFELYFEASNQESAVELKDRDGEVRDIIGRSLEQMNYDELVTVSGKERMKTTIRKNLNVVLTRGQVRRVFFKTIVLKP
jgi:flagellar basal body-associated protein FliL